MIIGVSGKINSGKDTVGTIIKYLIVNKAREKDNRKLLKFNVQHVYNTYPKVNFKIKKFADKLKDIVCLLIGCTREQLEDREFKEKELGKEWWYWKTETNDNCKNTLKPYSESTGFEDCELIKLTPRLMLQLLGTNAGRNIIHPNIWINALFSDYKDIMIRFIKSVYPKKSQSHSGMFKIPPTYIKPNWVVTDLRFPNELQAIKDKKGICIRVNRPKLISFTSEGVKPKGTVNVIRKLDNGKEIEWSCFWDDGWFSEDGISIPNVLKWEDEKEEHESETALDNAKFDYIIENNGTIEELIEKVKLILTKENLL